MDVRLIDTSFRDGSQSLWASGIKTGIIEAVAPTMDRAGFAAIEVPVSGTHMKKLLRDAKEDPWNLARMVARTMPNTIKGCMAGDYLLPFEAPQPKGIIELFFSRLAAMGALNRVQVSSNVSDQVTRVLPWLIPMFKNMGLQFAAAISYTVSPRHTDEHYAQKTREIAALKPDIIYLKDQGGLLTVDRARTVLPAIMANAGDLPVELHSHCTTGLAPLVYLEALKLGVKCLHTAVPPLASGSGQPSVFNIAENAKLMGYDVGVDVDLLRPASAQLMEIARQEGLPIGVPLEYDYAQYVHQVPGGVISNLRRQLGELGIVERLDDVLEETVRVRKDLGYPIMITPHSQFVVSQAALNIVAGERYKLVTDEIIVFALGTYGADSGYPWMDQNLRDRLMAMPRAKELKELVARKSQELTVDMLRSSLGGPGVSDEEFLLRYLMKGEREIEAMRAAGPPRQYMGASMPLQALVQELGRHKHVGYVHVERPGQSLTVENRSCA